MQGYRLLTRNGYILVYLLSALALAVSSLGTSLGLFAFGSLVWWPTIVLLLVVFGLELHRFYLLNLA